MQVEDRQKAGMGILVALGVLLIGAQGAMGQPSLPAGAFEREDAEIFRPATDGGPFLTVYDSWSLPRGTFSLGLWGDYANHPLRIEELRSGDTITNVVNQLGTLQLQGAVGVLPGLTLGLRVPGYFTDTEELRVGAQTVTSGGTEVGIGDVVVNGKWTLLDRDARGVGIAVIPELTLPSGDADEFMGTGELGYGGLLAVDFVPSPDLLIGLNFGGVIRDKAGGGPFSDSSDAFNDQFRYGGAMAYDIDERLTGIFEVYGGADTSDPFDLERKTPVDVVGALRIHLGQVDLTVGGGAGVTNGQGSPDYRLFVGLTPPRPEKVVAIEGANADLSQSRKTYALLDKDGDERPSPGDHLEYRIHVVNTGIEPAINILVRDRIPQHTAYVPGTLQIEGNPMTDAVGDDGAELQDDAAIFRLANLSHEAPNNEATVSFVVEVDPSITTIVTVVNQPSAVSQGTEPVNIPPAETQIFPSLREREHVIVGRDKIELTNNIHFEFDKATIQPESYGILDELAEVLEDYPNLRIRIEGHTDSVGTDAYNQKLSDRRALAVREYLVTKGILADRMEWVGRGETQPIGTNETATGRAMNRRMEFWVLNPEALDGLEIKERQYESDLAPQSEPAWLQQQGAPPSE